MKFTVLWTASAERRLARLWLRAADKGALASASDAIDHLLSDDAHEVGESRPGNRRIYHHAPLGVIFEVQLADRKATVLDVWRC